MKENGKLQLYQQVMAMAKKTVSSINSDQLLQDILEGIVGLFEDVNVGIIYVYDEETGYLRMDYCHNIAFDTDYPYLKIGEGVSGKVFEAGKSVILNSSVIFDEYIEKTSTYMNSFESLNYSLPHCAMSIPLRIDDSLIGVVTIYNYDNEAFTFTENDLAMVKVAADHAAIALRQSKMMKQQEHAFRELERNNYVLSKTIKAQRDFTKISLRTNSYDEIIESLSSNFGFDVIFVDPYTDVNELDELDDLKIPPDLDCRQLLKKYSISSAKNIKYSHASVNWMSLPVIGRGSLLGFLIAYKRDYRFSDQEEAILNHASSVIALQWLRKEKDNVDFDDYIKKFVDKIFDPHGQDDIDGWCEKIGFDPLKDFRVVFLSTLDSKIVETVKFRNRINNLMSFLSLNAVHFVHKGSLGLIINDHHGRVNIEDFKQHVHSINPHVRMAEGNKYHGVSGLRQSFEEADACLKMLVNYLPYQGELTFDQLGVWQLLLKLPFEELYRFAKRTLAGLIDEKSEKNDIYLETLKSYIIHHQHAKDVAASMNVHLNTVYFRMKKIEEILAIDLDDASQFLLVSLSCSILERHIIK